MAPRTTGGQRRRAVSKRQQLLERTRAAVGIPVLLAGGIVDREGVSEALDAGAVAAVLGTRFLLTRESHAHPDYKQRCVDPGDTVLTELFGLGWPDASRRVIANAATRHWLRGDIRGPGWIRARNRLTRSLVARCSTRSTRENDYTLSLKVATWGSGARRRSQRRASQLRGSSAQRAGALRTAAMKPITARRGAAPRP